MMKNDQPQALWRGVLEVVQQTIERGSRHRNFILAEESRAAIRHITAHRSANMITADSKEWRLRIDRSEVEIEGQDFVKDHHILWLQIVNDLIYDFTRRHSVYWIEDRRGV